MPFGESFSEFRDNGIFELHNASLDLGELRELRQYLRENSIPPYDIPHYQFHLSNVTLVPISAPNNDEPLRGVISGRDHIIGRKERHVDHIIRQLVNVNPLGI